jgi:hypothetical protein
MAEKPPTAAKIVAPARASKARRTHGGHALLQCNKRRVRRRAQDFKAPSIRPLKNSFCANAKATMPGTTTMT